MRFEEPGEVATVRLAKFSITEGRMFLKQTNDNDDGSEGMQWQTQGKDP